MEETKRSGRARAKPSTQPAAVAFSGGTGARDARAQALGSRVTAISGRRRLATAGGGASIAVLAGLS